MNHHYLTLTCSIALLTSHAVAGVLAVQSNPVANGAITVAPGNNDRSDWAAIPVYPTDPTGDASPRDWTGLQIAHDDNNVYFHLLLADQASPQFFGSFHNLYLDTDQDRGTGFFGGGGFLAIGSDHLVQGPSAFSFAGGLNQGSFSWNFLSGGLAYDDFPTTDIELAVPRATIGNPNAFDLFLNASSGSPEDYYPNGATAGAVGDYFTYAFVVPEPGAMGMFLVGFLALGIRRNDRQPLRRITPASS